MLSLNEVVDRCREGEIRITDGRGFHRREEILNDDLDPDANADAFQSSNLSERFIGDCLPLTLGPVVFLQRPSYRAGLPTRYDLNPQRDRNEIAMQPGDTLIGISNEYLILGPATGALILPRQIKTFAGLILTASHLRPNWRGNVQFKIHNRAEEFRSIKALEKVAFCSFFSMERIH